MPPHKGKLLVSGFPCGLGRDTDAPDSERGASTRHYRVATAKNPSSASSRPGHPPGHPAKAKVLVSGFSGGTEASGEAPDSRWPADQAFP
ncbi:Uncharacterised protein [Mycobacteroides abscessus subsp. abscessus]|nr:Uncharacterised protein [Mycobacteroides abscessus subsp. abscessus]